MGTSERRGKTGRSLNASPQTAGGCPSRSRTKTAVRPSIFVFRVHAGASTNNRVSTLLPTQHSSLSPPLGGTRPPPSAPTDPPKTRKSSNTTLAPTSMEEGPAPQLSNATSTTPRTNGVSSRKRTASRCPSRSTGAIPHVLERGGKSVRFQGAF